MKRFSTNKPSNPSNENSLKNEYSIKTSTKPIISRMHPSITPAKRSYSEYNRAYPKASDHILYVTDHIPIQPIIPPLNRSYPNPSNHNPAKPIISQASRSYPHSTDHIPSQPSITPCNRSYPNPSNHNPTEPIISPANQSYLPRNRSYPHHPKPKKTSPP